MFVPFHDKGIISQFEGYSRLLELDWDRYRSLYGNIERLDLILEAEGDSPNRYRLAKQADVLMLLYLLGDDQLAALLARLGYTVTEANIARNVDYYLARTVHGSTLSRVAHASVLAAADPHRAWATFREALDADLDDTQGGTTHTGVHLGAMAGSIDVVQRSFAGLRMRQDALAPWSSGLACPPSCATCASKSATATNCSRSASTIRPSRLRPLPARHPRSPSVSGMRQPR